MAEKLKYHYNKAFVTALAQTIQKLYASFDVDCFEKLVFDDEWDNKELKTRMHHITTTLRQTLPQNYVQTINILKLVAPLMNGVSDFGGFLNMFFPDFVELYGQDDWEVSMGALEEFTKYSSSEFAVRPFIKKDPSRMMKQMKKWAQHKNYHVRRLASEGCRPRLPWAMALPEFKKDPSLILPILHILKNDKEEYVRRSVANNLNDIAKDNPDIVVGIAKKWYGKNETTDKLVKHACRTLLKTANKETLTIFGFTSTNSVNITSLTIDKTTIAIGAEMTFSCILNITKPGKLRLEYAVDFMKANGKNSRKIFQIKEGHYKPEELSINKKHSFREMTTRKHYPGKHYLSLVINGVERKKISFFLE